MTKILCNYTRIESIHQLRPHPDNNNKHTTEQIERLSKIIHKNGWTSPITVSTRSRYITKGHARFRAAKMLDLKEVPVQYIDYRDEKHEYSDLTADNEIARWAHLDLDMVKDKILEFDDFDCELLGIENFDLEDTIKKDEKEEPPIEDKEEFMIVITCKDELEQSDLFEEFKTREIECKIMS